MKHLYIKQTVLQSNRTPI